jgi:hypothetical protein
MKIRFNLYLVIVVLLSSCSANEINDYSVTLAPEPRNRIYFDLDSASIQNTTNIQLTILDGDSTLSLLNRAIPSIDYFSLESGTLKKRFSPFLEGPNGIGRLDGYYILNDTIYVLNRPAFKIHVLDTNKAIVWTYNLLNETEQIMPFISTGQPLSFFNDSLFVVGLYDGDVINNRVQYFTKAKFGISIKKNSTEFAPSSISYPKIYSLISNAATHFNDVYYYHLGGGSFVFSFPLTSEITVFEKGAIKTYDVKTRLSSKEFITIKNTENPIIELENYVDNISYSWITFDSFNDVFYRLVELPVPESNLLDNSNRMKRYYRDYGIQIIDRNFKIIGEYQIPKDQYSPSKMFFVTKKGLYIKIEDTDEKRIAFEHFSLLKRESQ